MARRIAYLVYLFPLILFVTLEMCADPVKRYLDSEIQLVRADLLLKDFPERLSPAQTGACCHFLRRNFNHETNEWLIVRQNDLSDRLLQRKETADAISEALLHVLDDPGADLLWRDYCLQKLPMAFEQEALPEKRRAAIIASLVEYAGDVRVSYSGTALLGLYRLRESPHAPDRQILVKLATNILDHRKYALANKITALQIAVLLGDADALNQAREIVETSDEPIALKISAIAALGQGGVPLHDMPLIESHSEDLDFRVRRAVQTARNNLMQLKYSHEN